MGVADRRHDVCARVRGPGEHRPQQLPYIRCRAGDVVQVQGVERVVEGLRDLVPSRLVLAELQHQFAQYLNIEPEVPHLLVQYGEIGAGEGVQRPAARRRLVAEGVGTKPSARMSGLDAASMR